MSSLLSTAPAVSGLRSFLRAAIPVFLAVISAAGVFAQSPSVAVTDDQKTLVVEDAGESEVLSFGKNVIVKKRARGVFAFGGNVVVEGTVDEDVATIGGSVVQKEGAFIGGDVIVLGGGYSTEAREPGRNPRKETVVIGVFEEEFRNVAQDPSSLFSPSLTWGFFAQRLLSVLFWFIVSFMFTTISPGAVGRAVARFQLAAGRTTAIGLAAFVVASAGVVLSVGLLPGYLGGVVGLMMIFLLFLAYIFGRVALQVSLGKFLLKHLVPERYRSETLAILIGVVGWTVILSVPYVWTVALVLLFSASAGLVLTARSKPSWEAAPGV